MRPWNGVFQKVFLACVPELVPFVPEFVPPVDGTEQKYTSKKKLPVQTAFYRSIKTAGYSFPHLRCDQNRAV